MKGTLDLRDCFVGKEENNVHERLASSKWKRSRCFADGLKQAIGSGFGNIQYSN